MNPRPLTLDQKAARLHTQCPWLTHSEVMAELARRRRRKPVFGVLHPMQVDRAAFANVESPRYWWQDL